MADEHIDLAAARERTLEVIRKEYPPLLTSAHVAELMQCTIWEVRDQVHRGELPAVRWVSSSVSSARRSSPFFSTGRLDPTKAE